MPLLLLVACSAKVEAAVAEALPGLAVQAAQGAVALEVVEAQAAVALTQQALGVSAALAGPWFWSFDHAAICSC